MSKIVISFDESGIFCNVVKSCKIQRSEKGNSIISFPNDYTVIDLETTGLDPSFDSIIEIAALRIRNSIVVDSFSTLVNPMYEIDPFITELTGITNEMLSSSPVLKDILPCVREFIGDDIVIGHNVNFDINFLYDSFKKILDIPFSNDFIDTMRLSRKAFPEMNHHRLTDMVTVLNIPQNNFHRALSDCYSTLACYEGIFNYVNKTDNIDDFINSFRKKSNKSTDLHTITTENTEFDETHPLFGKRCVFTGTLEKMKRADAAQIVVDLGGFCDNGVTKKTNYLILGNYDYCKTIKDGKSSKQKKAEEYKLCGIDIDIIPENVFYDMIDF